MVAAKLIPEKETRPFHQFWRSVWLIAKLSSPGISGQAVRGNGTSFAKNEPLRLCEQRVKIEAQTSDKGLEQDF